MTKPVHAITIPDLIDPPQVQIPDKHHTDACCQECYNRTKRPLQVAYPSPTEKRMRLEDDTIRQDFDFDSPFDGVPISPITPKSPYLYPNPLERPIIPLKRKTVEAPRLPVQVLPIIISDNGKREWELIKLLGKGGCGEVFLGRELHTLTSEVVAIKIIKDRKQFQSELNTMKMLNAHSLGRGSLLLIVGYTPKLILACRKRKTLIMEYLSDTLASRFEQCGFRFSLKTICMIAINLVIVDLSQMTLVRDFNQKTNQAHVDIKPSNICTSANGKDLYLIDFGYSTSPMVKLPGQTGTPLFMACELQTIGATCNLLLTIDPSIQDDYESIGYVLMYLIVGGKKGLPWGGLRTHKDIALAKNDNMINHFCASLIGTEYEPLIQPLASYLFVTRDRARPFTVIEFDALYQQFYDTLHFSGYTYDKLFDWCDAESSTRGTSSSVTFVGEQFYMKG
ncbi:hypothetical protein HDV01_001174 [Terramyces sp. JEL0728]|nr:hypothetical protein HDV01_001174 [Terramyces sp. JEL0728]